MAIMKPKLTKPIKKEAVHPKKGQVNLTENHIRQEKPAGSKEEAADARKVEEEG